MNDLGCIFLEKGIDFEVNKVCDCCISHNDGRGLPVLINDYHGEPIDWENLFNVKAKRIAEQKEKTIYDCENCYHLFNYTFTDERKISEFHFSQCRVCNAKCIYCSDDQSAGQTGYDVYPIIEDLINKGYYKPSGEATMQGGEPTLMPGFDNLVRILTEHGTKVRVHSNVIKYSNTIEEALKKNMATVVTSLDCGSAKTYFTIKQINAFDTVCENISKYVAAAKDNLDNIIVKYILIPRVNDSIEEIDLFFALMKKIGVTNTAIDLEVQYARKYNNKNVSKHIYLLYDYFERTAKKLNIKVHVYSFLLYVLRNRKIKKSFLIFNKFLFKLYVNKNNCKEKNLRYRR